MIVVLFFQKGILPVHRKGVLRQVVRTDAQKVHSGGQFLRDHDRRGCFDHHAFIDIMERNAAVCKAALCADDHIVDLVQFLKRRDHRKHDRKISIIAGSIDCPQLFLKNIFMVQRKTDAAVAHDRIRLLGDPHILCLFVGSQIHGPYHRRSAAHGLGKLSVFQKQLVFAGMCILAQVLELASHQTDAVRAVVIYIAEVFYTSDVGIHIDFSSVQRHIGLVTQLQQFFLFPQVLLPSEFVFFELLIARIQIKCSGISVDDRSFSVPLLPDFDVKKGGNVHGSGHDRGMRYLGAMCSDHCEDIVLFQFKDLARLQLFGNQDHRFGAESDPRKTSSQRPHQLGRNLPDVPDPLANDRSLQLLKSDHKLIPGRLNGIACADHLMIDHLTDRGAVSRIPQDLKLSLIIFSHRPGLSFRLVVQSQKKFLHLSLRFLKGCQFFFGIFDPVLTILKFPSGIKKDLAGRDSGKSRFSLKDFHTASFLYCVKRPFFAKRAPLHSCLLCFDFRPQFRI